MTINSDSVKGGQPVLRDALALTLLIGVFFCFMLGNRPFAVPDEGRYVEIPREMVVTGDYITPRLDGVKYFEKPVLFYWLEALSIRLFGLHEFALRLWPAAFAVFGCLAVYLAGARLFGRRSGLLAAAVLATSLLYYGLSRVIILDMPVSVLLTVSLISFLTGVREAPGWRRRLFLWGFYVFAALAVLTKGLIGILIPALVVGVWIVLLGEWRILRTMELPAGLALFLLIAAPWHFLAQRANPEFFDFYIVQEHFLRYLTKMHSRYHPVWYFIPVVLLGLFPWSAFLVQAVKYSLPVTWKERHEHRDTLFLLLWAGLVFLFFSASGSKLPPYILPVFPPIALLIGRYLSAAWESRDFPGVRTGYHLYLAVSLLLAAAFLAVPFLAPPDLTAALGPYAKALAFTLASGAAIAWALARFRGFRHAFAAVVAASTVFLAVVNAAAPRVDFKSVKGLAQTLKPMLRQGDEVACYGEYYQDLPVYLERLVTIVGWKGELEFGTRVEDTSRWMIDEETFWQRWQGPTTVYLLTDLGTYDDIRPNDDHLPLYIVARDRRNILLTNREVKQ